MKTTLKIYNNDYEIEIKARDKRNLNASPKSTKVIINWLIYRILESKLTYEQDETIYKDIEFNVKQLNEYINESN